MQGNDLNTFDYTTIPLFYASEILGDLYYDAIHNPDRKIGLIDLNKKRHLGDLYRIDFPLNLAMFKQGNKRPYFFSGGIRG